MAMPLENHAFEPQFYSRRNPSASPFWKIVAAHYDDILPCVKIYLFFQFLKKSFIEAKDQMDVIEKILKHCKLWVEPVERAPPKKTVKVPFESVHMPIDEFLANHA